MNQDLFSVFMENATASGLSPKQAEAFINKQLFGGKTAEEIKGQFADNVLTKAGMQKTAGASAYVTGLVESASSAGLGAADIEKLAVDAVMAVAPHYPNIFAAVEKTAEEQRAEESARQYITGWFKSAEDKGIAPKTAAVLLVKTAQNAVAAGGDQAGLGQAVLQFLQQHQNPLIGGLAGAGLGGLAGAATGDDEEGAAFGGAVPGALIGGGLGALGGQGVDMLKDLRSIPAGQ